jgi:hypothetical protein
MKIITGLARSVSGLFGRKDKELKGSKLVGLYLSQANSKDGLTTQFNPSRQRRNGKYSHNRERA